MPASFWNLFTTDSFNLRGRLIFLDLFFKGALSLIGGVPSGLGDPAGQHSQYCSYPEPIQELVSHLAQNALTLTGIELSKLSQIFSSSSSGIGGSGQFGQESAVVPV